MVVGALLPQRAASRMVAATDAKNGGRRQEQEQVGSRLQLCTYREIACRPVYVHGWTRRKERRDVIRWELLVQAGAA